MEIYKKLYLKLFNGITDVINEIEKNEGVDESVLIDKLKILQIESENLYINYEESE